MNGFPFYAIANYWPEANLPRCRPQAWLTGKLICKGIHVQSRVSGPCGRGQRSRLRVVKMVPAPAAQLGKASARPETRSCQCDSDDYGICQRARGSEGGKTLFGGGHDTTPDRESAPGRKVTAVTMWRRRITMAGEWCGRTRNDSLRPRFCQTYLTQPDRYGQPAKKRFGLHLCACGLGPAA